MKINKCHIENFTVFKKQDIEFCEGVNVLIGSNGTGKSHLLKLLYAMTRCFTVENNFPEENKDRDEKKDRVRFLNLLNGIFKPENGDLTLLMRNRKSSAIANFEIQSNSRPDTFNIKICPDEIQEYDSSNSTLVPDTSSVFVPPNEVLAIYPGFTASYEKRELAFDQTYYDLCKALAAAPLKQNNVVMSRLILNLEDILQGKVLQKSDRFYVKNKKTARMLEAHLLAEGHRKIAALVHLIRNGSINKDTVLFWDEPESNLNPRLIKDIAIFLRELAKLGVQVFVATDDYLLTGELSLAAEYKTLPKVPVCFYAMNINAGKSVEIQSGNTLADLRDNPILDEFAAHYTREQDEAVKFMKEGKN